MGLKSRHELPFSCENPIYEVKNKVIIPRSQRVTLDSKVTELNRNRFFSIFADSCSLTF
jgi:hypothetical protein